MQNARLDDAQTRIKIAGTNINNFRYANDTALMAESEEELKSLLMKLKEQSEKAGLKLNIQKTKIMAPSPITSQQIDGETMECLPDPGIEPRSPALQADSSLSEPPHKPTPDLWASTNPHPFFSCYQKLTFLQKKKMSLIQVQNTLLLLNSFFQQLCVLKEAIDCKAENPRGVSISNWGQTVFL